MFRPHARACKAARVSGCGARSAAAHHARHTRAARAARPAPGPRAHLAQRRACRRRREIRRWRRRRRVACFVAADGAGALAGCAFLSFTAPEVRPSCTLAALAGHAPCPAWGGRPPHLTSLWQACLPAAAVHSSRHCHS